MPSRCVGVCPTKPSRASTTWTRRRWRDAARARSSGSPTSWAPSAERTWGWYCRHCSTRAPGPRWRRVRRRGVRPLQSGRLRSCPTATATATPRPRRWRPRRLPSPSPRTAARRSWPWRASRSSRCSPRERDCRARTARRRPRRQGGDACPTSSSWRASWPPCSAARPPSWGRPSGATRAARTAFAAPATARGISSRSSAARSRRPSPRSRSRSPATRPPS